MSLVDQLRRFFLRWSRLGMAGLLLLPLAISSVLGFLWLAEKGWLLWFVLASVALFAVARVARLLSRRRQVEGIIAERSIAAPEIDPDWSAAEVAAYERAQALIGQRLAEPIDWEDLPAEALVVVEAIATDLSGGKRTALDFTVPEGLLLIDRVASRYRDFLRAHVPFSDQLSVRALYWMWQKQDKALIAWERGFLAYRGVRMVLNPAVGVLREVERAITAGLQDKVTDQFIRDAQAILLEEAAQAAVDLYSGRLRFSDAELMQIELGSERRDRGRLAAPDDPVRVLVVGQVSAGKSTLINALIGHSAAETDVAPTTGQLTAHETVIDGIPCRLVDTMGLDGSENVARTLLDEMAEADLVLWVLRANRPARAPDLDLMARFEALFAADPGRRRPPVLLVASAADRLLPGWPFPENRLPAGTQHRLGQAMGALAQEVGVGAAGTGAMETPLVIPICAEPPEWNIDTLLEALGEAMTDALMTQRSRRRRAGAAGGVRLMENLGRASRGVGRGLRVMGARLLRGGRRN